MSPSLVKFIQKLRIDEFKLKQNNIRIHAYVKEYLQLDIEITELLIKKQ